MRCSFACSLLVTVGLGLSPTAASAGVLDTWYVFGDSLSDPGNLFEASGGQIPMSPPYFEGRFSDGPVWAELLPPEIEVINFAVGGARTGDANVFDDPMGLFEFDGLADQIGEFVGDGPADPDALYVIFAGSNNFLEVPEDPVAAIAETLTDIVTAALTLESVGAERFLIPNLPDFGLTPRFVNDPMVGPLATQLSDGFNAQLPGALTAAGIEEFEIFDTTELLRQFVSSPGDFGLSVIDAACLTLDPFSLCANPDEYLFWDDVHPTTVVHSIVAQRIFTVAVPEPGLGPMLVLAFAVVGSRRRR